MPAFSQNQVEEINAIIKAIEPEVKPKMEIGAKDRLKKLCLSHQFPFWA